jgi:carbonic anhydrase
MMTGSRLAMRRRATAACGCAEHLNRRALLGLGAGALAMLAGAKFARAAGQTEALLLSCMDYRLMDDVFRYMSGRGLAEKYDHVILAGASIGVTNSQKPSWGQTFWDHLSVAQELHHIRKVIVLDHRDCGAYKLFLGPEHAAERGRETVAHAGEAKKLRAAITEKAPKLEVETLLMSLDGNVEVLS